MLNYGDIPQVNQTGPQTYIKSVDVKHERIMLEVDNPHLDERKIIKATDPLGNTVYVQTGFPDFTSLDETTIITVVAVIEGGDWEKDQELVKYLRFQILQSRDRELSKKISNGKMPLVSELYAKEVDSRDYQIHSLLKEDGTIQKQITATFYLTGLSHKHVAYFVNCFIDVGDLMKDYSLNLTQARRLVMMGPIFPKLVYKNYKLVKTARAHALDDGTYWGGQVTEDQDGNKVTGDQINDVMMLREILDLLKSWVYRDIKTTQGKYYRDLNALYRERKKLLLAMKLLLKKWKVRDPNTVAGQYYHDLKNLYEKYLGFIKNSRRIKEVKVKDRTINSDDQKRSVPYEFICDDEVKVEGNFGGTDNSASKYIASKLSTDKYFSDALMTLGAAEGNKYGSCKFIFAIDFINLFKTVTKNPCLLKIDNALILQEVLNFIDVKYIKIYRREAETTSLGGEVIGGGDIFVVRGEGDPLSGKNVQTDIQAITDNGEFYGVDKTTNIVGIIKELVDVNISKPTGAEGRGNRSGRDVTKEATPKYRTFSVKDNQTQSKKSGTFEYVAVVGIEDKTIEFIRARLESLRCVLLKLKKYHALASLPCSYDSRSDSFTNEFLRKQYRSYTEANTPWLMAPVVFADVLRCFAMITDQKAYELAAEMYEKLEPQTSSPDKILEIIKEFEILESEITKQFDIQAGVDNYSKSKSTSKLKSRTIEVTHVFGSKIELGDPRGVGVGNNGSKQLVLV